MGTGRLIVERHDTLGEAPARGFNDAVAAIVVDNEKVAGRGNERPEFGRLIVNRAMKHKHIVPRGFQRGHGFDCSLATGKTASPAEFHENVGKARQRCTCPPPIAGPASTRNSARRLI